jgi:hypothetical protein
VTSDVSLPVVQRAIPGSEPNQDSCTSARHADLRPKATS